MSEFGTALLAVNQDDADYYKRIYPDIEDAKVFLVDKPRRMEGYRCGAVYATPLAREHDDYHEAYITMFANYVRLRRGAPRVI